MIDLSFLTEAEQEAILKVLNRDSLLKKAEEQRIRQLQDKVDDENELKYKSGQWFYEAKSRRHRDKIHGADLVRASIRKRKKPATIAELSQSSKNRSQRSWVNSINQDIFIPPEQYAVMEPPDETEEDLMSTKADTNNSAKKVSFSSPDTDKGMLPNGTASPAKQRKNPFNSENSVDATDLDTEMSNPSPPDGQVNGQGRKKNIMSSIIKYGVRLPYAAPISDSQTAQEAEEDSSTKQPPVPKPRKLLINGGPPERSNSSLQREDSLNGTNKRRGILKRRSSSSSTDSESIRIPPNGEPMKLVLPASPIPEAEQPHLFDDQVSSSENSPDRQKQVRFSEKVLQKPPTPNLESYNMHEIGEFEILDPSSSQNELDYEMVDYPHYEEFKPNRYSYNSTEAVDQSTLEEKPTLQMSLNSAPILDDEKKMEDRRREVKDERVYEILDERRPEINIDSAGTEPVYADVKKPSKSTSSDQEKDFAMEDALMEPILLDQRGKTERPYQREKTLEFGKSYGGGGKINYGSRSTTNQPGKVSTNEDVLAPEKASNTRSSYDYDDEAMPSTHNSDYFPKWRRPYTSENEDLLADRFVKPYPENRTNSKYSPGEHKTDTKYRSMFLKNTPEVEGRIAAPSSNFPVAQTVPLSSRLISGDYQTHETTLRDSPERRDLPKSANFKVMSLKDRIHDMPSEQVSNPSQFQSLKHFWNAEDKNWSKGDVAISPEKILTDVSKRNKPIRADLKQRNSKEIPISDLSLPSSFDSLSEEEQTSQKVASWLAQTPAVYGAEQVDADEDQVQPGEEVMENIDKTVISRKNQAEEFSSALQKLTDEALETPKVTEPEYVKSKDKQISPFKESDLLDQKKNTTTFTVSPAEKKLPPTKFYERVVQISNVQSPAKETNPSSNQYPEEEIEESVERSVAPAKTANEFKIGFQKLMEEYESVPTKSDSERHDEEPNSQGKEQQLIETEEIIDKSFVPKGNDHQEFIAALNRLKIEASTPSIVEDQDEQPETILMQNSASPVKSSFKIGFEHLMPAEEDAYEPPQKSSVNYTVQSSPHYNEDTNGIEEVVEKTSAPSRVDENDFGAALKKLEQEAAVVDPSEPEDNYEKPKITPTLQSARSFEIPRSDIQNMAPPSDSLEKKSAFEDPLYSNRSRKSSVEAEDAYVTNAIPEKEKTQYSFYGQGKLPVEEETIEKTFIDTEESNADYKNRLMRLEEEAATSVPEEPEDLSVGDTFHVSPAPTKEVFISKKVFNSESMPVELPSSRGIPKDLSQQEPYAYKELANYPQSPSDQSGSFTDKKPGSSEVSNSKKGKPALAGSPSDSSSSKDKYTIEVMKAQDESISKVLDWFSRSSDSVDDQMPTVGLSEESKTSPQKLISNADKLEDKASGHDVDNLVHGSEATQQMNPIPQMARNLEYKDDMKTGDGDQPKIMNTISLSPGEDEFVPPQQMPLKESLEFGKSGSGSGKMLHSSIDEDSLQKYPQHPVEGEFEKGKESLTESLEFGKSGSGCGKIKSSSINDNPLQEYPPLAVEGVSETDKDSLTELLEFGKSGSGCGKIQSSSVDDDSIQKHPLSPVGGVFEKDNLETEKEDSSELKETMASLDEDDTGETPVGKVIELKEVLTPTLEQKDQSSKNIEKDISIIPQRRVSDIKLLWEGDSSSQDATKQPVLSNIENPINPVKLSITPKSGSFDSDSPQECAQLPVGGVSETDKERLTELLEFGKGGSGCGKIQSSSSVNEDSLQKYPQFSMGAVFERDKTSLEAEKEEGSELKHKVASLDEDDTGETPVDKVKDQTKFLIPTLEQSENKSLTNMGEDIAIIPQTRASDVEPLREGDNPSKDVTISNVEHPFSPVELSTTTKSGSFDSDFLQKDSQLPAGEVSETEKESLKEFLEFGKSGSGGGKLQSRSINDDSPQKYPQLSVFENDNESLEAEKDESSVLKEKMASLDEDDTRETPVDKVKDQTKVLTPTLEQKEGQSSQKTEKDISIIPKRRVSDIKLLWEGDKPSQDATKKPVLSDIKRPLSPVESSITPKSNSLDSDDQNGASLVTFKKVIVEDEDDPISPINKLKSFWENDKNKDTTNGKPDRQPMENENWTEHKGASMADPKSKFKKRHTIHTLFETEKSTDPEKNFPGRSVLLGESENESLKDRMKSASFQSLKNFWNTSSKSDNRRNNQALPENTTKQFGSNPDIRIKEPFILKAKSRLEAKSLHDIRQDPSAVSQFHAYNAVPTSRKFSRGNSKKEDQQKSVSKPEIKLSNTSGRNDKPEKPIRSVDVVLQKSVIPSNYQKSSSTVADEHEAKEGSGISDGKQRALTKVLENSVDPKRIAESETSLGLKTLQDEVLGKNINSPDEKPQSPTFENCPDDQSVYRDEENGEMNEKGRKMLLVKQNGFDVGSPVLSNVAEPLQENEKELSENEYSTGKDEVSDLREVVNENIEKTVIPPKNDSSDFDRKLQNLYNESLNTEDLKNGNLTEHEYMGIDEPVQTFSKVLAVSSGNIQSSGPYKDNQPIIINISSKKTEIGNEGITQPQQDNLTETSLIRQVHSDVPNALGQTVDLPSSDVTDRTSEELASEPKGSLSREPEVNEISPKPNNKDNAPQPEKLCKKEVIERIEMPVVLPKTRSSYFDEKLKQLYEESQSSQPNLEETADSVAENNEPAGVKSEANVCLYSNEPKKTFLKSSTVNLESSQSISADRETLTDESAPSGSQAPDILLQEVNETIEKTVAPKRISNAKSLEELQKEALNEEAGELVGNVSSGHMTLNESIPKLNDQALRENGISETIPREKEDPTLEGTEYARYENHEEGTPETSVTFMSDRQSTPVKDKNGSLRRSTLELYLEAPYRREISKSIDFDTFGYVPSNADKYQNKLNSQKADTLGPTENSFPENADKLKRMSQSVPAFLQDDTDGRETDSASESSFKIGRHKKSPSSLTNLSGSSGMASMSSVSGSVMSVYSGDFGNVDIKGSIEFAIDYVQELKEFHIFVYQCKDLAAADVKKQRSDPYVKAYLLPEKAKMGKRKSAVKKKTLNPVYNEILRYKIPKESLEAQTLNVSVWHHDALGRNSFLGEVNVNLATWDWQNTQRNWYPLEARTPASGIGLMNRGEIRLSLQYIPVTSAEGGKKPNTTGEVQIWIKECIQLPMLRENKINSFVKCTILPDTSRKSRQKTRTVDKTPNPIFNHKMIYDGFKEDDLREACVELTVWDHNKLSNHFLGGTRIGLGTGKSYGTAVDWMDSSHEEAIMWEKMITSPNTWIDGILPLRMFKMAKLAK